MEGGLGSNDYWRQEVWHAGHETKESRFKTDDLHSPPLFLSFHACSRVVPLPEASQSLFFLPRRPAAATTAFHLTSEETTLEVLAPGEFEFASVAVDDRAVLVG